jgi:hypothetical protein
MMKNVDGFFEGPDMEGVWHNSRLVNRGIRQEAAKLKQQPSKDIGDIRQFLLGRCIDEIRLDR